MHKFLFAIGFCFLLSVSTRTGAQTCSNTKNISQSGWNLLFADSQETTNENGSAINAFDGNPGTYWHTKWSGTADPYPHELQIDLGASYSIVKFKYMPRQDGSANGRVKDYEIYISSNSNNWGTAVATGTFANDGTEKIVSFPAAVSGRYLRFRALNEVNGNPWATAAEINLAICDTTTHVNSNGNWDNTGPVLFPTNASGQIHGIGRVTQLKYHPSNASTIYCTSVWGLWKSTDNSASWKLMGTDQLPKATCASLCIDHTSDQVIYLGTGDPNYYSRSLGVYKTTDGGQSWQPANNSIGNRMAIELLMSPADPNVLVAATDDGIWKTINGGATWSQKLAGGQFSDMVFKAVTGSTTLFAVTRDGKFYRSTDMGETWSQITSGLTIPANGANGTRLAVSPANSNIVYVGMIGSNSGNAGGVIFQSTDGGTTFTQKKGDSAPNIVGYTSTSGGQGNYNFAMGADRTNASIVYVVAHLVWKSTNSGTTWTQMQPNWATGIHTDMHGISVNPYNTSQLFNINDGGVWLSTDAGSTWTPKSNGLASTEIYHASSSPIRKDMISIGTQDNGELYYNSSGWFTNRGGDFTSRMNFDDSTNNLVYYYGSNKRRPVTGSETSINIPFATSNDIELEFCPASPNIAFVGGKDTLARSTNISASTPAWTTLIRVTGETINALHVRANNPNTVYFVTKSQKIYRSENAGGASPSFTALTAPAATSVAANITTLSSDSNIVYLSCCSRIFRSADKGTTWADISGNLPSVNIITIAEDRYASNESIYIATARGVYHRTNAMSDWDLYSLGLPTICDITDMFIYNNGTPESELRVSFYGRGVFGTRLNNAAVPSVSFASTTLATTAAGTSVQDCRPYTDYTLNLNISTAPTGNAIVKLATGISSSAVKGLDYDFTTNGSFSSPSDSLVFLSGQSSPKTLTLRVYGTKTDPGEKTALLTLSVSGSTNAVASPSANTCTIKIAYPDASPVGSTGSGTVVFGTATTQGSASSPFNGTFSDKKLQTIYPASELRAAGLQRGTISSVAYYINGRSGTGTSTFQNFNFAVGITLQTTFTQVAYETALTTVYSGTFSVSDTGWVQINFSQPFYWDGSSSLLIQACYDNPDESNVGDNFVASLSEGNPTVFQRLSSGAGCSITSPAGYGSTKPNLKFTFTPSTSTVATALNTATTQYLGPNATVYFYDNTDKLAAKIENLSSFDYGCTSLQIDRAGTSANAFWNNTAANYLASKTLKITPANNSATGQYKITMYYTEAEKQGWETATGQSWNNIQIVKVKSQIGNVTPSNPSPDGSGTIDVARDTSGVLGSTIYYAAATFNTGLGGFGAGIPGTAPGSCGNPTTLTSSNITSSSTTVNWTTVTGAVSYDVDYKPTSSGTWISGAVATTATSVNLSGLTGSTSYDWRVRANCSGGSSSYATAQFTTAAPPCPSTYDNVTNDAFSSAVQIPLNTDVRGKINPKQDKDYYWFTISNGGTITISLTTLPANYNLTLYNSLMLQVASSQNTGTANETINYTALAGNYYVVVGPANNNAFNAGNCYTLNVTTGTASRTYITYEAKELSGERLSEIYPNPVKSLLTISLTGYEGNTELRLLDATGRLLLQKAIGNGKTVVNTEQQIAGVYFVQIRSK
jgi:trimeric autotransporter adhesin